MGIKSGIKKLARFIVSESEANCPYINIDIAQINYGGILKDRTIIVTGGGKGLGYNIAKKCISEGAEVIISGRNEDNLKKTAAELGNRCHYIRYDVTEAEKASDFLKECKNIFGKEIDWLVSNAGISLHEGHFSNVTIEDFDRTFNTNFRAGYFLSKAFLEMKLQEDNPRGGVLFITSETGNQCYDTPYGMTKAALNSLTGALSRRVYRSGLRVNAVAPGVTVSDMTRSYSVSADGNTYRECASGRTFLPEEVAEVVCFMLSDASKCISGEIIHCNAGNHLRAWWDDVR